MQIQTILLLILIAVVIRLIPTQKLRRWLMLGVSIGVLFWLQPASPIRYLDFFLPLTAIIIGVVAWLNVTPADQRWERHNLVTIIFVFGLALLIGGTRYFSVVGIITPSRPPSTVLILLPILVLGGLVILFRGRLQGKSFSQYLLMIGLIFFLAILKSPFFIEQFSILMRTMIGQTVERASSFDIRWLGFSYIAFRLIHTILDAKNKRLKDVNLQEYLLYLFFFPAISAGPIDRIQRFLDDIRTETDKNEIGNIAKSGWRIILGLFKKFALADTLALIALNPVNASQVFSIGWMWILLYAYSFQILFDFSGYTDIAIGLGGLMGVYLPENFNRPYLKHNLKLFWDHWHMTLTQWFRTYYFNPTSRKLRRRYKNLPTWVMVFLMQISTMILIGLWHGVTWNFVLWGLWHGLGLFLQNRWSEWLEPKLVQLSKPGLVRFQRIFGTIFTFNYVALGWVFFVLPTPDLTYKVFAILFGG